MKPRVLLVGRTRYRLPLSPGLERKFAALREQLDVHVLASAAPGTQRGDGFTLVQRAPFADGLLFWLLLPFRTARLLRSLDPDAVLAQTAYEGAAALVARRLAASRAKIVLDVHGDWRTATRLYGSPLRRALSPFADTVAEWAIRRADAVRTLSPQTTRQVRELGVEPAAEFPAFVDLEAFTETPPVPLPAEPSALFVGVLERYKAVDVLVDAWRRVTGGRLRLVGVGPLQPLVDDLVRGDERVTWTPRLEQDAVVHALDEATVLLLPSRSEGLPRIVMEAFCRGRPVVGSRRGGTPDLVHDGVNGLLVDAEDGDGLARAIERVLSDAELAERLAEGARASAQEWARTPEDYAASVRELVERA